ncbi:MAG: 50S ribosomal protein L21 [Candidatus Electryonea clarkiae]|nr:50S ribosomal protein L21 [Candidatus Electryonea clarkiae]MDP8286026.1 50S ribosomal protein L21 [Candidatus Electryonea clarkiae]
MHNYVIAEISGYQYRVQTGETIQVPRLSAAEGDKVTFDRILLSNNEGKLSFGAPYLDGASFNAKVIEHTRSKKVRVFKKKRRKGYKRTASARQYFTKLEISEVNL